MLGLVALLSAGNPWGSESLLSLTRASAPAVTITPAANAPRTDDLAPAFLRQLAESAPTPPACDGSDVCALADADIAARPLIPSNPSFTSTVGRLRVCAEPSALPPSRSRRSAILSRYTSMMSATDQTCAS